MPDNVEIERSYLAAAWPQGFQNSDHSETIDIYFPASGDHPKLRIRKNTSGYELTKKLMLDDNDASSQKEQNIELTEDEFEALAQGHGRKVAKTRYCVPYQNLTAEVDVFGDGLKGLVLIEFEFDNQEALDTFEMPEFCLADVTQEAFIAGGVLAGKKYEDIAGDLERFGYKPLAL